MSSRKFNDEESDPLSAKATGEWYRTPRGVAQRYEQAKSADPAHWYLDKRGAWRAFRDADVKQVPAPVEKKR